MSDIDTIREALKQAEKIIGKQPGLTSSALAALDRLQAQQQPNAEPVAWMNDVGEFVTAEVMNQWKADAGPTASYFIPRYPLPLYAHPPASTEPRLTVDGLANEIRTVDGSNSLSAGALAEALMPYLTKAAKP